MRKMMTSCSHDGSSNDDDSDGERVLEGDEEEEEEVMEGIEGRWRGDKSGHVGVMGDDDGYNGGDWVVQNGWDGGLVVVMVGQ